MPDPIASYFEGVPPAYRPMLRHLREVVLSTAPEAEELLSYRMPAFRRDGILLYYAAFRDHCSLFVASPGARRNFAREFRPFEAGKGTLRFDPRHPIPDALLVRLVKFRLVENARRAAKRRTPAARTPSKK